MVPCNNPDREARYKANPDYMLREVAEEYILIPVGQAAVNFSGLINLNETGALLWRRLQEECTADELAKAILDEYEVDRDTAAAGVAKFLQRMQESGLLLV